MACKFLIGYLLIYVVSCCITIMLNFILRIYYFDPLCTSDAPSEANGELRVRYCEIVDGDENNIADSGSVDYSEEEGLLKFVFSNKNYNFFNLS